ncbi:MAG: hypothetical protein Q8L07_11480 [Sediminibacterium sp.]|nr:hypothetical protein [Sediminibacterium sp.]
MDHHSNRIDTINFDFKSVSTNHIKIAKAIDTSSIRYFFHTSNSIIVLKRSRFYDPIYFIPYTYCSQVALCQYSKSYDTELKQEQDAILQKLRPWDLITIPMRYEIVNKNKKYKFSSTYLDLFAGIGMYGRKTLAENREIESLKGKIVINDNYGNLLQWINDIEIEANSSLPSEGSIGLLRAIGEEEAYGYYISAYRLSIYVGHKDISNTLKEAVNSKHKLSIEFVPDIIKFKDGTVLK